MAPRSKTTDTDPTTSDRGQRAGAARRRIAQLVKRGWPWTVGVVGVTLIGGLLGHLVTPPTAAGPQTLVAPVPDDQDGQDTVVMVPDVLGLERDIAARAISDAGLATKVTFTSEPAAGDVGLVISQNPPVGQPPGKEITLTVSAPATMSDAVGKSSDDVRDELEDLGAVVVVEPVVRPDADDGTVVGTTPRAGRKLGQIVTLQVAEAGEALSLDQVTPLDSSCGTTGQVTIDGTPVDVGYSCDVSKENPGTLSFNLARKAALLTATVGIADTSSVTTGSATVTVYVDGKKAESYRASFGAATTMRVLVSNALRVRIEVATSFTDDSWNTLPVVLGDLAVTGTAIDLDALADLQ